MEYSWIYESPIGNLTLIVNDTHLLKICFNESGLNTMVKETELIKKTKRELDEYFAGKRTVFTIPLDPRGTEFQKQVWSELLNIPYGQTISYKELAEKVKNAKYSRAVGMSNNKNPIPIIIPCHRVIGSQGKLVGYRGGLNIKEKLINLENNAIM